MNVLQNRALHFPSNMKLRACMELYAIESGYWRLVRRILPSDRPVLADSPGLNGKVLSIAVKTIHLTVGGCSDLHRCSLIPFTFNFQDAVNHPI